MLRGPEYLNSPLKRDLDVIGGGLLALALAPAAAVSATAICIEARSFNPFFTQPRIGAFGEAFIMYKFRTLRRELTCGNPYKSFGIADSRALTVGKFLRRTCLDEVPQLLNVFKGEMSLVGYRPLVEADRQHFKETCPDTYSEWEELCNAAKPGLTGPSQLRRRNFDTHDESLHHQTMTDDIRYLQTASFLGDLQLIAQTLPQILDSGLRAAGIHIPGIAPFGPEDRPLQ